MSTGTTAPPRRGRRRSPGLLSNPFQPQTVFVQNAPAPGNGLGVAGFVLGLLGLLFCWLPGLGITMAALGIIMGGVGIATGKEKGAPVGLAIADLVLGIIALIPAIVIIAAVASNWAPSDRTTIAEAGCAVCGPGPSPCESNPRRGGSRRPPKVTAAVELLGWFPRLKRFGGVVAALFGGPMATYTSRAAGQHGRAVVARAHDELPFVFAGSAMAAGGDWTMTFTPIAEAGPSRKMGVTGASDRAGRDAQGRDRARHRQRALSPRSRPAS